MIQNGGGIKFRITELIEFAEQRMDTSCSCASPNLMAVCPSSFSLIPGELKSVGITAAALPTSFVQGAIIAPQVTAHDQHISVMGDGGYERLAEVAADRIDAIRPAWVRDWTQLVARRA